MRQLSTCDFCDGHAAGTFEIVPPELNPTEAEQRRVVLCDRCRAKIDDLVKPLLARAGADSSNQRDPRHEPTAGSARDAHGTRDAERSNTARTDGAAAPSNGRDATRPGGDAHARNADGIIDAGDVDQPNASRSDGSQSRTVVTPNESPEQSTDGVAIRGNASERETDASQREPEHDASENEGAGETPAEDSTDPRAYAKVLRLLQNRDFPMARADVETLAAGAYDLEDHEVAAIVDHAVEKGDLTQDGRKITLG